MNTPDHTDGWHHDTEQGIRALFKRAADEATAKERARITNALQRLTRPTRTHPLYNEGWNDALERATLHVNGDR